MAVVVPLGALVFWPLAFLVCLALKYMTTPSISRPKTKSAAKAKPAPNGVIELPGLPILGSLIEMGDNHVRNLSSWAQTYGPVFLVRLGKRRIVFANTFDSVRELWVKHHAALISRPIMHTFHDVASGGKDFTIGSSPWHDSCKKLRQIVARNSTRTAVQGHTPVIGWETEDVITRLFDDGLAGKQDVDVGNYMRHYAINMVLRLYYGLRLHHDHDFDVMHKLVYSERQIARVRSTCNNWQDYVFAFRLWPQRDIHANKLRIMQDDFTDELYHRLEESMKEGTEKSCVVGDLLKSHPTEFSHGDLKSLCLSTIAASVLTVPGNLIMPVAWLSSEAGQETQQRIYDDIQAAYPDGDAWDRVLMEEKVPRLTAFIKETLRFFTVLPMSLPRRSVKDVEYNGTVIPAGTEFHMNAWAANNDPTKFDRPFVFQPERFLRGPGASAAADSDLEHFSFGAGSRMCPGMHLGNRIVYTMLARLILTYRILPARREEDLPNLNALECRVNRNGIALDPKPFKCGFEPRSTSADDIVRHHRTAAYP